MFVPLLVLLCLGLAHSNVVKRAVEDKGTHFEICEQEPIELGIVLDSSRSIKMDDFGKTKQFLRDFLDHFYIGNGHNDVRVSLIPFGRGIYPQHGFNLTTYTNKAELLQAVLNLHHEKGGRTDTGSAIEYMHLHQLTRSVVRPWAEKISVVITDGNSQRASYTADMAAAARADNITVFSVGIGSVDVGELLAIAGIRDRVTQVKSFDSLDSVKGVLAKKTCIRKAKPTTTTTTPMPQTSCGEMYPADVNFVFSPADMGIEGTAWSTSFMSNVLSTEDMDVGFRYGVVSGSCPDDSGFPLDQYDNLDAIRERLMGYDRLRLPGLARKAAAHAFTHENGARDEARNIAVLFASGGKKGASLQAEIDELLANGVEVFIARPGNQHVSVHGATVLAGGSTRRQSEDLLTYLCPQL